MNDFRRVFLLCSSLTAAMALVSSSAFALPNYSISTGVVAFGSVPLAVSTPAQIAVTITNVSGGTRNNLQMAGGGLSPPPFGNSQNCQGANLAPNGTCQVVYTFSPVALGPVSVPNSFTIDGEPFALTVSGTGVSGLTVTPTIDFGPVPLTASAPSQAATVTNVSAFSIGPVQIAGGGLSPPPFGNSQNCQGATLPPGGTCQVFYTFSPVALGPVSVANGFSLNGAPFTVAVSGTGISGLTVTPAINFGSVLIGAAAPPQAATVTNVSAFPIGPVQIAGGGLSPPPFGNSQNCQGVTLAPNGTCQVIYTFTPVALGPVSVANNFSLNGAPFTVAVSGIGTSLQSLTKAFGSPGILLNGSTSLSFTAQNLSNATTLHNVSFTDDLPSGLVVSTPNGLAGTCGGGTIAAVAGSGTVSLSGATLAPLASCTFSVNVRGTTTGTKDNVTGPITSTESGGGTATASLQVSPPPPPALPIPTLTLWGLLSLSALMISAAFAARRRRREHGT
jgi:hypothetical protein